MIGKVIKLPPLVPPWKWETGKSSYFEITPLSPPLEMGETENPVTLKLPP
jgi:hypothetical protein